MSVKIFLINVVGMGIKGCGESSVGEFMLVINGLLANKLAVGLTQVIKSKKSTGQICNWKKKFEIDHLSKYL